MNPTAGTIAVFFKDFPLGGSERIAIRLMNRWAALGRKVVVFAGALRGPLVDLIDKDLEVHECHPARGFLKHRSLGYELARFVEKRRPDLLFVPGNFLWPALPNVARVPDDIRPTVVTQISTPLYRRGRGPVEQVFYNMLQRYRLSCANAAISLAPSVNVEADYILGRRITQAIPLPALDDDEGVAPLSRASGKTIVVASRLVPEKCIDVALRAFAHVRDKDAKLVILGEGRSRGELEQLARDLGIAGRVQFEGYVPCIQPWLERARVFMLSSLYEGYGATLVEALAAGRPVVSTDCGPAIADLLQALPDCAIAPVGDARALGDCLNRVLSAEAPDPRILADTVAGYRIGPIAKTYLSVFDRVHARRLELSRRPRERLAESVAYV